MFRFTGHLHTQIAHLVLKHAGAFVPHKSTDEDVIG